MLTALNVLTPLVIHILPIHQIVPNIMSVMADRQNFSIVPQDFIGMMLNNTAILHPMSSAVSLLIT